MSNHSQKHDPLLATEEGKIDDQSNEESIPSGTKRSPTLTAGLLATLAFTAVTLIPSSAPWPQEHRRLSSETRRMSSVGAEIRQAFIFVVGTTDRPDDEIPLMGGGQTVIAGVDDGQCLGHTIYKGFYSEVPFIWAPGMGEFGIQDSSRLDLQRTFEVQPNHTVLENGHGVVFNVETVPDALPEDARKERLTQQQILSSVEAEASKFYGVSQYSKSRQASTTKGDGEELDYSNSMVEVMSRTPTEDGKGGGTVFASGHGFLAACMTAFAYHLPLALTPDDIWTVIANGFARHVNANAEDLRSNFVDHEGQEEIRIREDSMVRNTSPAEQWEALIFPKFTERIANSTNNPEVIDTLIVQNFTTSTVASRAASEILLMSTMKSFFKFQMDTMCGIPNVRLDGTRKDWVSLRERTKSLAQWMLQNNTHGDLWIYDIVLPILDEFLLSYDGEVNYCFWQNMVKFRSTGMGSGSYDFLSGWLPTLFPYLNTQESEEVPNPHLRHWMESARAQYLGPRPNEIPLQMSSVPVTWNYLGQEVPIHFHAGFRGVHQEEDGTVRPILGWYVTEDPN